MHLHLHHAHSIAQCSRPLLSNLIYSYSLDLPWSIYSCVQPASSPLATHAVFAFRSTKNKPIARMEGRSIASFGSGLAFERGVLFVLDSSSTAACCDCDCATNKQHTNVKKQQSMQQALRKSRSCTLSVFTTKLPVCACCASHASQAPFSIFINSWELARGTWRLADS